MGRYVERCEMKSMKFLKLQSLRHELLVLHERLLEYQRQKFEKKYGRINAGRKMFYLVTTERSFAWIGVLTELIVGVDGLIDSNASDDKNTTALFNYTKKLLSLNDKTIFNKEYNRAVQSDPEVLIVHHKITSLLKTRK